MTPLPTPSPVSDPVALRAIYEQMKGKDHFEVLGVKRDAAAARIKASYFHLAKTFHPDASPADEPAEVKKLRADIFALVSGAWAVLGEDDKRARYLEDLRTGGTESVDIMAILKAEETFQLATVLVKSRKYDEALRKIDEAIGLNGAEAEFRIWKAWVEFLLAPGDRRTAQHGASAAAIEAALRTNPRCIPGFLFLGQMAKLVGDVAGAERHFRRGLSADPHHADLQRELKYVRK